jgi:hypothetical protein
MAFSSSPGIGRGLLAVIFNRSVWPHRLLAIHSDEPDLFTVAKDNGIAVNDPGAYQAMGLGTGKACEKNKEG